MPKDKSMEYAYYWHIDKQGTIDRVICIYIERNGVQVWGITHL